MPSAPQTFRDIARRLTAQGAVESLEERARDLEARAGILTERFAEANRRAARGLRIAARILGPLSPSMDRHAPFRPVGLRGAIAAGHLAIACGRPAQAELVARAAFEAAPDSGAGLRLLGLALAAQGRHAEAVEAFREGVALDPGDRDGRALLAEALIFDDQPEDGIAILATLGELERDDFASAVRAAWKAGAYRGAGRRAP